MNKTKSKYEFIQITSCKIGDLCPCIRGIIENELKKREKGIIHGITEWNDDSFKTLCGLKDYVGFSENATLKGDFYNGNITCDNCKKTKIYESWRVKHEG